jgi:hypothetical protein
MLFGVAGLLSEARRTRPAELAAWLLGSAVAHDAVLAPVVFGLGILVARAVPATVRRFVQGGLVASGMLVAAMLPFVGGWGRQPDNPSALPGSYGGGLAVVLGVVWAVVGLLAAREVRRTRRR